MSIRFSEEISVEPDFLSDAISIEHRPARRRHAIKKRLFDLTVCVGSAPIWVPVCLITGLTLFAAEGRPVLYRSVRRVYRGCAIRLIKFRTMVRDAEAIANRETLPIAHGQRFLNIPVDSVLYTKVGRFIERSNLTEIPQLVHVMSGRMSLIGSRPLPENVISSLKEVHDNVEHRFVSKCGLTGPVQLIGRDYLADSDRLRLEAAYCRWCSERYSIATDFKVLILTILVGLHLTGSRTYDQVYSWFAEPEEL